MQITRTADYAVRAVIHLASKSSGACVPAGEISRQQKIPATYAAKVLQLLARAGIVLTTSGRSGGASLLRDPSDISLLDIVEAVDGPVILNRCLREPDACPLNRNCAVHPFWKRTQKMLTDTLRKAKVAQFCRGRGKRAR
jgi:Rrf2 family protein